MITRRLVGTATWLMALALAATLGLTQAQNANASAAKKPARPGILILAHGGSAQRWDEDVRHLADQVDLQVPTEVAFGMAQRSTIQAAVNRLTARGVTEIVAIPLFISSHSSLVDSTAYLLGLRSEAPEDLKMFASMDREGAMSGHDMKPDPALTAVAMNPVQCKVPIRMATALDHHPIVADILRDRAASISKHPRHEVVLLIAHGPVADNENALWLADMKALASEIHKHTHYAAVDYLTLRDDADDPVRNTATEQLRQKVKEIDDSGRTTLIVPLLLSYGGIEGGIEKRLSGLTYRMASQGLLPDPRLVSWVIDEAQTTTVNASSGTLQAQRTGF